MEEITLQYACDNLISRYFVEKQNTAFVEHKQTEVSYGTENDVDLEYCKDHDIPCYNLHRSGGSIVYFKGNVSWADVRPNDTENYENANISFLRELNKNLREKGINSILEGNDILIDGYKVASGYAINLPPDFKKTYSGVQINVNCDVEIIKKVCKKEMKKTPKALSDYGITTQDMVEFVKRYFKTNEN